MIKPRKKKSETTKEYNERASKLYYANGYHIKEIAQKLKINEIDVYNYVVVSGSRITTSEERDEMITLYNKGYSISSIAKIFSRSRTCVRERIDNPAKVNCYDANKLTDDQIAKITELASMGLSIKDISSKTGINPNTIIYRLSHTNIRRPNTYVTKSEIRKFIQLFKKGKTHREIANICGRSRSTINRHLHAAGYWRKNK